MIFRSAGPETTGPQDTPARKVELEGKNGGILDGTTTTMIAAVVNVKDSSSGSSDDDSDDYDQEKSRKNLRKSHITHRK